MERYFISWNPEVIILLPYCPVNVSIILSDPVWQALPAVQNKQVYRMPKYLMTWEMPVPESVLATMWMEQILHTNQVRYNFTDEMKSFYKKFYRLDLSDEEIKNNLHCLNRKYSIIYRKMIQILKTVK